MAVNDVYLCQTFMNFAGDSSVDNVWTYRSVSGLCDASNVVFKFSEDIIPALMASVSAAMNFEYLQVMNMNDPTDFVVYVPSSPLTGAISGAASARFLAASIKAQRKSTQLRSGFKRISVLAQATIGGDVLNPSNAGYTALVELATVMSENVTNVSLDALAEPIIIKRNKVIDPDGKETYVVPPTTGVGNYFVADNWQLSNVVTSQATRKANRGS